MIYAMKYLRGEVETFQTDTYDFEAIEGWKERINEILCKRRLDASEDWKAFGEELSGCTIQPFDIREYPSDYAKVSKDLKDQTTFGRFIIAAMRQKSMVTNAVFTSGNILAGISVDYWIKGFKGIKDFKKLIQNQEK